MHRDESIEAAFGHAVRRERSELGMTQAELADAVTEAGGTVRDRSHLARLELGRRQIRLGEAVLIARALGCSIDAMIGDR